METFIVLEMHHLMGSPFTVFFFFCVFVLFCFFKSLSFLFWWGGGCLLFLRKKKVENKFCGHWKLLCEHWNEIQIFVFRKHKEVIEHLFWSHLLSLAIHPSILCCSSVLRYQGHEANSLSTYGDTELLQSHPRNYISPTSFLGLHQEQKHLT